MKRLLAGLTSLLLLSACSGPDSSGGVALNKDNTSGIDFGAIKGVKFPSDSCEGLPDRYAVLPPISGNVVLTEPASPPDPTVYRNGSIAGVFSIAPGTNLSHHRFDNWKLCRMNLTGANLSFGGFDGRVFDRSSSYRFSVLNNVQMERGWLVEADFSYSQINSANLKHANLRQSVLDGSRITNTNLSSAILSMAFLREVNFTGSNFVKANLDSTKVDGANFMRANLLGANLRYMRGFESAIWTGVQFDESTICPNGRPRGQIGHNCPF